MHVNEVFDAVEIINVVHHHARRRRSAARFHAVGIEHEFVPAVDGSEPEVGREHAAYLARSFDDPRTHPWERIHQIKSLRSPGAYAYLLSMRRVLERARTRGLRRVLVCDDDCIFIERFVERFAAVMAVIPPNWQLLKLGASDLRTSTRSSLDHARVGYYPIRSRCDGSFAVGIDHSLYDEILAGIAAMNFPFDSGALSDVCLRHPDACFVCCPNLMIADVRESTIREPQDLQGFAARANWDLRLYAI